MHMHGTQENQHHNTIPKMENKYGKKRETIRKTNWENFVFIEFL